MSVDVPVGWSWAKFSEVARIAPDLVDPVKWPHLPHIAPDNIERDTGRLLPYRTVREDGVISANHRFHPGQLLYSKIRPYLNKCVRVDFDGLCSADMYPVDAFISERFLHHFMLTRQFVSAVSRAAGSRTILPKTNQAQMAALPVPVAPLPEQHRIAEAIDSYLTRLDDAIASLERVQAKLKAYRASVLKAAVEGHLVPTEASLARAEKRAYEPADALLARILKERRRRWEDAELAKLRAAGKTLKDDKWRAKYEEPVSPGTSTLPELPEGWCWATVDQLSRYVFYGSSAKASEKGEVPVIRMGNIVDGSLDLTELKFLPSAHDEFPDLLLEPGDLLFNRTNSAELVGKTAIYHGAPTPCSFASYLICVRVLYGVESAWICHAINSLYGRLWIASVVTQQVGQANVNGTKLKAFAVPLPPLMEQQRLLSLMDELFSKCEASRGSVVVELRRMSRLRQSILRWAFEGKLVDQDPNDELAEKLLARIRAERAAAAPIKKNGGRRGKGAA